MHIGLYFGSFNPIHNGHLTIAQYMYDHYNFDEIWFVVSPSSPFKQEKDLLDENIRLQMVKAAIEDKPYFFASDIEFDMPKPSYTYMTLRKLRRISNLERYSVIMGSDNVAAIEHWKNYSEILRNHTIYIYPRTTNLAKQPKSNLIYAEDVPILEYSSSYIREKIYNLQDNCVLPLLPEKVWKIIKENKYYL